MFWCSSAKWVWRKTLLVPHRADRSVAVVGSGGSLVPPASAEMGAEVIQTPKGYVKVAVIAFSFIAWLAAVATTQKCSWAGHQPTIVKFDHLSFGACLSKSRGR